jgi:hypothetical protein
MSTLILGHLAAGLSESGQIKVDDELICNEPVVCNKSVVCNQTVVDGNSNPWGIESGSNANGSWMKFPDGTLMQWIPQLTGTTGDVTWTFPVPFFNTAYAGSATCWLSDTNSTGYMVNFQNNESRSVSSLRMRREDDSGTNSAIAVTCTVIGRWK